MHRCAASTKGRCCRLLSKTVDLGIMDHVLTVMMSDTAVIQAANLGYGCALMLVSSRNIVPVPYRDIQYMQAINVIGWP